MIAVIIFIGIIVFYVLPCIVFRKLNYFNYVRGYENEIMNFGWYIPIVNIFGMFLEIGAAIYGKFGIKYDFAGKTWYAKKVEYTRRKQIAKHKDVDPLGEETWEDEK
jgi:hypothetical protein